MEKYHFTKQEQTILEGIQQPFAVYQYVDSRVVTLVISDGFCRLFGYDDRELAYQDMDSDMYRYTHPDDVVRTANAALRFATEGGRYEVIYRSKTKKSSEYMVIHAFGEHVMTKEGARLAHVWYTDEGKYVENAGPAEIKLNESLSSALHEQSILQSARYDYLTGLPGLNYFFELAEAGKTAILGTGGRPVILYIDFCGMKFFNSRHGFVEGDRMLQTFARILARMFSNESCCHIGADHFAVVTREEGLDERLEQLFKECREINGRRALPIHIGVYPSQRENVHASVACDRAKLACNALKGVYASAYRFYSRQLKDEAERRQYIIENVDRAIEEKWIQVYYQPIIRAVSDRICDEEALARWIDPVHGFLSPAEFIPYLEETGLIYKLDLYVLDEVLEKIRIMREEGIFIIPHSINLSRSDFDSCDIVEEIRKRVDAAGVPRDRITIEITESVIGSDFDFMKEQVGRFQELGFPVWMDDFGSGYSSLDVLQSIKFNLLKFDMSFMRKLNEGENGRIILTELMKMASALGVDTVCEGVETQEQAHFLQEIGCSKLQGYFFSKPNPLPFILEWNRKNKDSGYEDPEESSYYESMGSLNLYDLAVISSGDENSFQNAFSTLPMGVIEIRGDAARFVRSNQSYRDFARRFFGLDLSREGDKFVKYNASFMHNVVRTCCEMGARSFYDEKMPDGSVVHSFARRIGVSPVSGNAAVAVAILSITEPGQGETYADIARTLASDYYNIYVVDLDTDRFIEYSSSVGAQELAIERHGKDFFESARRDSEKRIYEEDRELFLGWFTRENVLKELDQHGVFTSTYRLIDTGEPMYVSMKILRMQPGGNRIIIGISVIDSEMKKRDQVQEELREREMIERIAALSGNYLCLYTIHPDSGRYIEYNAMSEYESLGFAKEGEDFFIQGAIDGKKAVFPEDLPEYLRQFTRENVMREIREKGRFRIQYRLILNGQPRPVTLRIAPIRERGEEKLVAGVRLWRDGRWNGQSFRKTSS